MLLVISLALRLERDRGWAVTPGTDSPVAPTASQGCPGAQAASTSIPMGTGAVPCPPVANPAVTSSGWAWGETRGFSQLRQGPKAPLSFTRTLQGPRPPLQPWMLTSSCILSSTPPNPPHPQSAQYIPHEFALRSFWAEADEGAGTQHPLHVLMPAQGTCHTEERLPFAGTQPCPTGVLGGQLSPAAPFPFSSLGTLLPHTQIPTGQPVPVSRQSTVVHPTLALSPQRWQEVGLAVVSRPPSPMGRKCGQPWLRLGAHPGTHPGSSPYLQKPQWYQGQPVVLVEASACRKGQSLLLHSPVGRGGGVGGTTLTQTKHGRHHSRMGWKRGTEVSQEQQGLAWETVALDGCQWHFFQQTGGGIRHLLKARPQGHGRWGWERLLGVPSLAKPTQPVLAHQCLLPTNMMEGAPTHCHYLPVPQTPITTTPLVPLAPRNPLLRHPQLLPAGAFQDVEICSTHWVHKAGSPRHCHSCPGGFHTLIQRVRGDDRL